uniref:Uncharacterized protein n=1 Tax=Anguilla anguilla TaxID=7936 RepID=A0A0E9UIG6_ANGAN
MGKELVLQPKRSRVRIPGRTLPLHP